MSIERDTLSDTEINGFLSSHRLPDSFVDVVNRHYLPLARGLPQMRTTRDALLLGINGAQGTGKSTLADFLRLATRSLFGWTAAVLSIDDFYYTLSEREALARDVHPLLRTRGVPGTHDVRMLARYLDRLKTLGDGESVPLPRFDKACDDRANEGKWPCVSGPVDMVILEGWCVGTVAQDDGELQAPANELERRRDADGAWRRYVNEQLRGPYARVFALLDALVFLQAPSFDAIFRWRLEQERKLADASPPGSRGIMSREQVARFIAYYERLTRANLVALPSRADVVYELDESHAVTGSRYR